MVPVVAVTSERLLGPAVLRAWVLSRAVVLAALLVAHLSARGDQTSLLARDGAWYADIAAHGYAGSSAGAVRYFPLWPELAHQIATFIPVSTGTVLVVAANLAALVYLALARRVTLAAEMDFPVADRLPGVVALAPTAVVLVMGYSEALFGVVLCAVLLTARRGHWLQCAAVGVMAGALRPTGVLLCLSVAIEATRGTRTADPTGLAARLAAALAPAVGLGGYLAWCAQVYGDALAPFHAQTGPQLRGGVLVNPISTVSTYLHDLVRGQASAAVPLHCLWILVAVGLLIATARRLPTSYTVFALGTLFLAATARNFSSFERYACSALPLLISAALVLAAHPRLSRVATIGAPLVAFGYAFLTFTGRYVP
jgi:hypothetical protein